MSALPALDTAALGRTTIYVGDCRETLQRLPAQSVHCVVTSPPYFGLRDYGTGQWQGGDPDCTHKTRRPATASNGSTLAGSKATTGHQQEGYRDVCARCGAVRVDRQIGLEASMEAYLETMVDVFREVWRVLRDDGTLWLDIGDSYSGSGKGPTGQNGVGQHERRQGFDTDCRSASIPAKNLMLIPWRLVLALQADGWIVRSVISWQKAAPMPESVTDRPTSAWEPIFLLTKQGRYFYDAEAVREKTDEPTRRAATFRNGGVYTSNRSFDNSNGDTGKTSHGDMGTGRNLWNYWRDLDDAWLLGPEPFPESHFAVFPTEIPRRAILAGTSAKGVCPKCGAPWRRVVERTPMQIARSSRQMAMGEHGRTQSSGTMISPPTAMTTGWQPSCDCNAGEPIPATVLDPFGGVGTTALVANRNGRNAILCELNPTYADMAARRIRADLGLLAAVDVMDSLEVA